MRLDVLHSGVLYIGAGDYISGSLALEAVRSFELSVNKQNSFI
jgi:hypothetical protein